MSNYQTYLDKLHLQKNTDSAFLDACIYKITKSKPIFKKRIVAGEINEVYEIKLKNNKEIILRISHNRSKGGFYQEKWAFQQCRLLNIPCPEVIAIQEIELQGRKLLLCFENKLPGHTLGIGTQIKQISPSNLKKILIEAGNILSKIHSISISGFGHLKPSGQGIYSSFIELMTQKNKDSMNYLKLSQKSLLSRQKIQTIISIINKTARTFPNINSFMVHGDFGPKHIVCEDNKITGIIDFEDVLGHSPVFDLARWEFFYGDNNLYKYLIEGYQNKSLLKSSSYEDLFYLIQLDMGLDTLSWYCSQDYKKGIQESSQKLLSILSKFC